MEKMEPLRPGENCNKPLRSNLMKLSLLFLCLFYSTASFGADDSLEKNDLSRIRLLKSSFPLVYAMLQDDYKKTISGKIRSLNVEGKSYLIQMEVKEWVDLREFIGMETIVYRNDKFIGRARAVDCNKLGLVCVFLGEDTAAPEVGDSVLVK